MVHTVSAGLTTGDLDTGRPQIDVPAHNDVFCLFVLRAERMACWRGTKEANLVLHLHLLQKGLLPSGSRLLPFEFCQSASSVYAA